MSEAVSRDAKAEKMLPNAEAAFVRYEAIRHRLPKAEFPEQSQWLASLEEVADHVDGFLLDAFGVLNVG